MCDVIETSLWDVIETCLWDVIDACLWDVIETCMGDGKITPDIIRVRGYVSMFICKDLQT
jgi:hypothetical protein